MDVQYFIDKFNAIPEEKWGVDAYQQEDGRRCALGHCMPILNSIPNKRVVSYEDLPECWKSEEFDRLLDIARRSKFCIPQINDVKDSDFPQETPKQRILAFLKELREKEKELEAQDKAIKQVQEILSEEPQLI